MLYYFSERQIQLLTFFAEVSKRERTCKSEQGMKDAAAGVRHSSEARHKFASRRSWRAKHLRLSSGGNTTRLSRPDTGCLVFSVQSGALAFMPGKVTQPNT